MKQAATIENFTSLRGLEQAFTRGVPILTYHKIMPPPRGTRFCRFLYLPEKLFAAQLGELSRAGFRSAGLEEIAGASGNSEKRVVFTFDDAYCSVLEYALPRLKAAGQCAITFVVAGKLGGANDWDDARGEKLQPLMDAAQIRAWLDAGQDIGSHTLTHPQLSYISKHQAREEIFSSKKKLEDLFGVRIRHFCYPYGDYDLEIRDLVQEAGYETACTTRPGLHDGSAHALELPRLTARYASRNLRNVLVSLGLRKPRGL